jgi:hypothetical protein
VSLTGDPTPCPTCQSYITPCDCHVFGPGHRTSSPFRDPFEEHLNKHLCHVCDKPVDFLCGKVLCADCIKVIKAMKAILNEEKGDESHELSDDDGNSK